MRLINRYGGCNNLRANDSLDGDATVLCEKPNLSNKTFRILTDGKNQPSVDSELLLRDFKGNEGWSLIDLESHRLPAAATAYGGASTGKPSRPVAPAMEIAIKDCCGDRPPMTAILPCISLIFFYFRMAETNYSLL